MPQSFFAIPIAFEYITYALLILSMVTTIILGWRLRGLRGQAEAERSRQDIAIHQISQLLQQSKQALESSDRRFHNIDQALQSLAVSTVERLSINHQEQLRSSISQNAASHATLQDLQEKLLGGLHGASQGIAEVVARFERDLGRTQKEDFDRLEAKLEAKLEQISRKVIDDFDANLKTTQKAFNDVVARLARIDAAQQKIEDLSRHVVSLQDILADKKTRGAFGETQLAHILTAVFGENTDLYSLQCTLPNKRVADVMMHLPDPVGDVAVDSKFPLENYQRMMAKNKPEAGLKAAAQDFGRDFKKHIDDIADRYIIPGHTSNQAILFLPAEAIFAEIHSHHTRLISYAQARRVWIVSPTTFMAQLSTIQMVVSNLKREKYAHVIQQELSKLATEFGRYQDRWLKLSQQLSTVSKSVNDLSITSDKISKRFEQINEVNLPKIES